MMISDMVAALGHGPSEEMTRLIERKFLDEKVGLRITGIPIGVKPGDQVVSNGDEMKFETVSDPNGRPMIKTCLDPATFEVNYPNVITATMTGREVIEMLIKCDGVAGILMCSATAFVSYPLYRDQCLRLIEPRKKWSWLGLFR